MRNVFMSLVVCATLNFTAMADDTKLISVVGSAEKAYQPDIAYITVTVWGKGVSAKKAQEMNQKYYQSFDKSLKKFNIKQEHVQTSHYSLNPEYVYNDQARKNSINGYEAIQSILVTLKNTSDIGPFIDSLSDNKSVNEGGINLGALSFDISTRQSEEINLMTLAVENAQKTADVLARAAKVKIKRVHRISPLKNGIQAESFGNARMKSAMAMDSSTSILTGEVKVSSEVAVDFEIN